MASSSLRTSPALQHTAATLRKRVVASSLRSTGCGRRHLHMHNTTPLRTPTHVTTNDVFVMDADVTTDDTHHSDAVADADASTITAAACTAGVGNTMSVLHLSVAAAAAAAVAANGRETRTTPTTPTTTTPTTTTTHSPTTYNVSGDQPPEATLSMPLPMPLLMHLPLPTPTATTATPPTTTKHVDISRFDSATEQKCSRLVKKSTKFTTFRCKLPPSQSNRFVTKCPQSHKPTKFCKQNHHTSNSFVVFLVPENVPNSLRNTPTDDYNNNHGNNNRHGYNDAYNDNHYNNNRNYNNHGHHDRCD